MTSTMTGPKVPFAVSEYMRLPEGAPYVLVGGHLLMSPSPTFQHQRIFTRLVVALHKAARRRDGDVVSHLDTGIEEDTIVRPDVLVLLGEAARSNDIFNRPALAIEILQPAARRTRAAAGQGRTAAPTPRSPGKENYDRGLKWEAYRRSRLHEVWLADPERRSVTVQCPDRPDEEVTGKIAPGFAPEAVIDSDELLAA